MLSFGLSSLFFFFKQKSAYEFRLSLVGSEMCIRDRRYAFLVRDDDMSVLKLCREGVPPADDPFFAAYDRQEVVVTGRMSHGWLVADAVEAAADAEEMDNGETTENREQA